jgi:hypothetical protein
MPTKAAVAAGCRAAEVARMNLLDWFRREPSRLTVQDDVVWLTTPGKHRGIRRRVASRLTEPEGPDAVLLVAHFSESELELRQIADAVGGPVRAVSAEHVRSARPASMSLGESHRLEIIVGERHPLRSRDDAIADYARSLPCQTRLVHHVSLDEPLLRAFAGEWVQTLLKQLGLQEDEAIESSLVARRIKAAQQRVAQCCRGDLPANSAAEWLAQNCPAHGRG